MCTVLITYFNASKLGQGDTVTKVINWTSDGDNSCPGTTLYHLRVCVLIHPVLLAAKDWANHGYCKDDEPCM